MKNDSKALGALGEKIAQNYLKKKGYKIIAQNYIPSWTGFDKKEIDIIARKENLIVFFEVKTLQENNIFFPEEKVNYQKRKKIIKVAESFLLEKRIPLEQKWQIDVIAIRINLDSKKAKIRHFENISLG
jgi:putative endonuclease